MGEHIAQFVERNCCMHPREHPAAVAEMDFSVRTRFGCEGKTQENGALLMASSCLTEMASDEVRRSRKRRHRRGKSLHKHRLSKHRRDVLARAFLREQGNHRVLGAPRNDNDFIMSQYIEGLHVEETHPEAHPRLPSPDPGCFFAGLGRNDEIPRRLNFSPNSSPGGSTTSSGGIFSDYSSLPSSPDDTNHCFDEPNLSSQLGVGEAKLECGRGIVMDGTDADFLQRNFEEEYTNNITRCLQEATKEELISKYMKLTEKLKFLEQKQFARLEMSTMSSREPKSSC